MDLIGPKSESRRWFKLNYQNSITYTHSSALRTMQEIFNARPFPRDAANATDLSDLFVSVAIPSFGP